MKRKTLADLLAQYVDDLNRAASKAAVTVTNFAEDRRELQPLIPIIVRLAETLVPVEPSPEFRDALRAKLIAAWYDQQRTRNAISQRRRRGFFLKMAAVGSFMSVAALVTVVARWRANHISPLRLR